MQPPGWLRRNNLLEALWIWWIVILPFAHLTGLRNFLAALCIAATFSVYGLKLILELPGKFAILSVCIWAIASTCWSADRGASWTHLKDDLAIDVFAYAAAFTLFRNVDSVARLLKAFPLAVVGLTLVSSLALIPGDVFNGWIPVRQDAALGRIMPIWYPGMGDASMFFAVCIAPLILLWSTGNKRRIVAVAGIFLIAGAMVTRNRAIALVLPASIGFYVVVRAVLIDVKKDDPEVLRHRLAKYLLVLPVALLAAGSLGEVISHQRFTLAGIEPPPWGNALIEVVKDDPRPKIWREYLSLGMSHPFVGVGFGRTVPATAYHTKSDPILVAADAAAPTHAHNLFIDIWLQLGLVGLGLSLWIVVGLVRSAVRFSRESHTCALIAAAFLTLVFATGIRCLTDDLLTYALGSAFWILCGAMLGWQSRIVCQTNLRVTEAFMN